MTCGKALLGHRARRRRRATAAAATARPHRRGRSLIGSPNTVCVLLAVEHAKTGRKERKFTISRRITRVPTGLEPQVSLTRRAAKGTNTVCVLLAATLSSARRRPEGPLRRTLSRCARESFLRDCPVISRLVGPPTAVRSIHTTHMHATSFTGQLGLGGARRRDLAVAHRPAVGRVCHVGRRTRRRRRHGEQVPPAARRKVAGRGRLARAGRRGGRRGGGRRARVRC